MNETYALDPRMAGIGLLVGRLVFGILFAAHGSQKLFGWFRGYGLQATGEFFAKIGFTPGRAFAAGTAMRSRKRRRAPSRHQAPIRAIAAPSHRQIRMSLIWFCGP